MSAVLDRPPFCCPACRHEKFMLTFGGKHQPVITCQACAQSYEVWPRSAVPVRLVHDDGSFAELPIQAGAS